MPLTIASPSERFVRLLENAFSPHLKLSEQQLAELEDAFDDAVIARVERMQREADRSLDDL